MSTTADLIHSGFEDIACFRDGIPNIGEWSIGESYVFEVSKLLHTGILRGCDGVELVVDYHVNL